MANTAFIAILPHIASVAASRPKRRSLDRPRARHRPAHDLQQRRPHARPRNARRHVQEGRQPAAVLLGEHADRSDVGRAEVPHRRPTSSTCSTRPSRTTSRRCCTGTCRARSTARRRSRSPTSPAASPGRRTTLRSPTKTRADSTSTASSASQQQRRRVRGRAGPAGRRHDQPRREDRPTGADADGRSEEMD